MSRKKPKQPNPYLDVIIMLSILVSCVAVGTFFYHTVEHIRIIDAFYFASMTLTTIGDAEFAPKTDLGKIFTVFYAFVGIGVFLGFAAAMFGTAMDHLRRR